jgi:hypothetical protein
MCLPPHDHSEAMSVPRGQRSMHCGARTQGHRPVAGCARCLVMRGEGAMDDRQHGLVERTVLLCVCVCVCVLCHASATTSATWGQKKPGYLMDCDAIDEQALHPRVQRVTTELPLFRALLGRCDLLHRPTDLTVPLWIQLLTHLRSDRRHRDRPAGEELSLAQSSSWLTYADKHTTIRRRPLSCLTHGRERNYWHVEFVPVSSPWERAEGSCRSSSTDACAL